ncbi:MAG: type VI secretion system contractile sheath small subunit, partial [Planctomycetes bacterium]|nr:type VI secretion system contractile sheath small subunit [Planctomycetota bacterium]
MSARLSLDDLEFALGTRTAPSPQRAGDDAPFSIAILGDFTGRGAGGPTQSAGFLSDRRPIPVDVDNIDRLPGKLAAGVHVPAGDADGPAVEIGFGELDDFHPDRLFDRLEV